MNKKLLVLFTIFICTLTACSMKSSRSVNININGENIIDAKAEFDTDNPNLITTDINTSQYSRIEFGKQNGKAINWYIVAADDDHYILLSEKVLDVKYYDDKEKVTGFTESTLYDYLNSDFINETFTNEEREKMVFVNDVDTVLVTLPSTNNLLDLYGKMNYVKDGFYNDKSFFEANDKIIAKPTDVAIYNEIDPFDNEVFAEILQTEVDKRYDFANGYVPYWLLNIDDETGFPLFVTSTGYVGVTEANTGYIGIRPLIRIEK